MKNTTPLILSRMLKENTGKALCDSGDHYGRNWEANQNKDFRKQPASVLKFSPNKEHKVELETCSHNVFHFLNEALSFDSALDRKFQKFAKRAKYRDERWETIIEDFCEAEEMEAPECVNTYNGEDMLSQIIQYYQSGRTVFLQIHGGCDARGGYTAPRVFEDTDCNLYGNARGVITPEWEPEPKAVTPDFFEKEVPSETPRWETDDGGYRFRAEGDYSNLGDYATTDDPEKKGKGEIYIDDEKNGYCPITGRKLVLNFY